MITETHQKPDRLRSRWHFVRIELGLVAILLVVVASTLLAGGPALRSWIANRAYEQDQRALQGAVSSYPTSPRVDQIWPTLSGEIGLPLEGATVGYQCDQSDPLEVCSWIDLSALTYGGHLPGENAINSANLALNVTATNAPTGTYGWYIDGVGHVSSEPIFSPDAGYP